MGDLRSNDRFWPLDGRAAVRLKLPLNYPTQLLGVHWVHSQGFGRDEHPLARTVVQTPVFVFFRKLKLALQATVAQLIIVIE